jgi:hypothetical protein
MGNVLVSAVAPASLAPAPCRSRARSDSPGPARRDWPAPVGPRAVGPSLANRPFRPSPWLPRAALSHAGRPRRLTPLGVCATARHRPWPMPRPMP